MTHYAEGTTVTVPASRGDITGILTKHGVTTMAWGSNPEGDYLAFELAGHSFRLDILKPTAQGLWERWKAEGKSERTLKYLPNDSQVEAEWRRRWRATVLLLKAKLEFADGETSTIEKELLPYILLRDGMTLGTAIELGKVLLMLGAGKASR